MSLKRIYYRFINFCMVCVADIVLSLPVLFVYLFACFVKMSRKDKNLLQLAEKWELLGKEEWNFTKQRVSQQYFKGWYFITNYSFHMCSMLILTNMFRNFDIAGGKNVPSNAASRSRWLRDSEGHHLGKLYKWHLSQSRFIIKESSSKK